MPTDDVYLAAARAYCRARYSYTACYSTADGAEKHLEADAQSTATEAPFRAAVDAAEAQLRTQLAAALGRIADSEQQSFICIPPEYPNERATRAIRRDAFLRSVEVVRSHTAPSGTVKSPEETTNG